MMARFLLFIEGPAFFVFSGTADEDKKNVQQLMLTSFSLSKQTIAGLYPGDGFLKSAPS